MGMLSVEEDPWGLRNKLPELKPDLPTLSKMVWIEEEEEEEEKGCRGSDLKPSDQGLKWIATAGSNLRCRLCLSRLLKITLPLYN